MCNINSTFETYLALIVKCKLPSLYVQTRKEIFFKHSESDQSLKNEKSNVSDFFLGLIFPFI